MDSQKSADDIINQFDRSCSCSNLSDTTLGVSSGCCAKDIVDKLMVKLEDKEKQLQEKNQTIEKLSTKLETTRAVKAAPGTNELKTELANAHKTVDALQLAFWKAFPSPHLFYHIKMQLENGEYKYLYADNSGYLCSSTGGGFKDLFKFEKDPDGTISIYSKPNAKYLQILASYDVTFLADANHKSKVALIFHPQQNKQLPGILVDIFSLANGSFLSPVVDKQKRVTAAPAPAYNSTMFFGGTRQHVNVVNQQIRFAANSHTAPSNKFLILAADVE